jgi:hypothetical protein
MRQMQSNKCTARPTGEFERWLFGRAPACKPASVAATLGGSAQDIHLKLCPRSLEVEVADGGRDS